MRWRKTSGRHARALGVDLVVTVCLLRPHPGEHTLGRLDVMITLSRRMTLCLDMMMTGQPARTLGVDFVVTTRPLRLHPGERTLCHLEVMITLPREVTPRLDAMANLVRLGLLQLGIVLVGRRLRRHRRLLPGRAQPGPWHPP